jgi:hypothetical protein
MSCSCSEFEPDLSHLRPPSAEVPDAGQGAVVSLDHAVISARAAGMSVRDVAKEFGITRYRVEKLDKTREPAALNGRAIARG